MATLLQSEVSCRPRSKRLISMWQMAHFGCLGARNLAHSLAHNNTGISIETAINDIKTFFRLDPPIDNSKNWPMLEISVTSLRS